MRITIPLFFAAAILAPAQIVSFGVKAGAPLTDAKPHHFSSNSRIDTGRWTVGPTVEFRVVHGLSVEFDALYREYSSTVSSLFTDASSIHFFSVDRADTKAWDLPLLLKYRFIAGPVRPFLTGGYSVTHESSDVTLLLTCLESAASCRAGNPLLVLDRARTYHDPRFRRGPVAGAGLEFKFWKIKIAPEIRYSRLDNPNTNQATVLAGFTF